MRNFHQFMQEKNVESIAETLAYMNVDVDIFCENVISFAATLDPSEPEVINEFMGGMSNVLGAGMNAVGRGIGAGARAVGGAIGSGARAVGRGIGAGARAVGNAATQSAQAVGQGAQHVGNLYQQGENKTKLQKIMQTVQGLQQELAGMGFDNSQLSSIFDQLKQTLQQVANDSTLRIGPNGLYNK
jgi:hypothetical protein